MSQETTGFWDGTGIRRTICKQPAPSSRQITTPTPHHSIFTGQMLFLTPNQQCQSTESNQAVPDKGPLNSCLCYGCNSYEGTIGHSGNQAASACGQWTSSATLAADTWQFGKELEHCSRSNVSVAYCWKQLRHFHTQKCPLQRKHLDAHTLHASLGTHKFSCQMASQSVRPVPQRYSPVWRPHSTDRLCGVAMGRNKKVTFAIEAMHLAI